MDRYEEDRWAKWAEEWKKIAHEAGLSCPCGFEHPVDQAGKPARFMAIDRSRRRCLQIHFGRVSTGWY